MNIKIISILTLCIILFSSCININSSKNDTQKDINFNILKGYFIKNTITKLDNPKIEDEDTFNNAFGMATVMWKKDIPTKIDFSKQYVIAVVLPETNITTKITPINLYKNKNNEIIFAYKINSDGKQTYTSKPILLIAVDKSNDGKVILKPQ